MRQVRPLVLVPALVPEVQGEYEVLTKHSLSLQNKSQASMTGPSTSAPHLPYLFLSNMLEGLCAYFPITLFAENKIYLLTTTNSHLCGREGIWQQNVC